MQASEKASSGPAAGSGSNTAEQFASYDLASSSWRTHQACLIEAWASFSGRWPSSGTMRNGVCARLARSERRIFAKDSGSWPTPNTNPTRPNEGNVRKYRAMVLAGEMSHAEAVVLLNGKSPFAAQGKLSAAFPTPRASSRDNCGGANARQKAQRTGTYFGRGYNPSHAEWLMGFPPNWIRCTALQATPSSPPARSRSSKRSVTPSDPG